MHVKKLLKARLEKFWEYGSGRMVLAAVCAHSVSVSIGICQGYSAILIPQLILSPQYNITMEVSSWLASLGAVTNPLGSIASGVLAEYMGRKIAIQLTTIPFLLGWLCIGLSTQLKWIYIGRIITGIAAGMASASYTYVSEISTPESRGVLQALGPISASFGILLTYVSGYFFHWKYTALISIFFCIYTLISMTFLPESPAHLVKGKDTKKIFEAYLFFRRSNAKAQEEVEKHTSKTNEFYNSGKTWRDVFCSSETVKPFLILVTLFFLQEMSGIYSILFYTVNFFEETHLDVDDFLASIVVGGIRFFMSIVTAFLINKFARRVLCVVSSFGMACTLLPLLLYIRYYEMFPSGPKFLPYLPLVSVIFNVFFSMLGMLPIPYILVGEYFPLRARSIMSGFVICIAQTFIFISVKIYPHMNALLGFSGTLFTFFVASCVAVIFCKFVLPETKDKSLEDIEEYFRGNNYKDSYVLPHHTVWETPSKEVFSIKLPA
ncbi:facilitated trehalose transporter Tret1-like [Coccinella septempunctata]|uniref:facilitated trehalose transporter Tret1-like n=1 Tax=Coccinella septempunctata TaxID=41139 RepID=UPI001D0744A4|nr:facilitated trehalose transporter Tret1-like [Coccinella septempunctata]